MRLQLLAAALLVVLAAGGVVAVVWAADRSGRGVADGTRAVGGAASPTPPARAGTFTATPAPLSPSPTTALARGGGSWGSVTGLLQFRGNPTRTFYGRGPVPADPQVRWRYPERALCTEKVVGYTTPPREQPPAGPSPGAGRSPGAGAGGPSSRPAPSPSPITKLWCGTGWTGQPAVRELSGGTTEVVVGAFDGAVHFLDAASGRPTRPLFRTGDMIKGSVTLDPDGFPLLYTGSRDGNFHVATLDRGAPTRLWTLPASSRRIWNDDFDGNASVVDDVLYLGGEDGFFYAVKLNRAHRPDGKVTIDPEVLVELRGWTDELVRRVGDNNVSIESSVAVDGDRAYFTNSAGRVVGLDISDAEDGEVEVVLDFWVGADVDASPVVDGEGMLYVAAELERDLPRAREVGQILKLDPARPGDPVVWSVDVPPRPPPGVARDHGGVWATPALHDGVLYVTTHPGDLLAIDAATGRVTYREDVGHHEWSSPVVVDQTLVVALCQRGGLRAYDLADPRQPRRSWELALPSGACIESTPAVWEGGIYVGARDGFIYGIG